MKKNLIALIVLSCCVVFACSKDEEEVTPKEFTSQSYDVGHLSIQFDNIPAIIDCVLYVNYTQGTSDVIDVSEFAYISIPPPAFSLLTKTFGIGNTGDSLECCVYFNTPTNMFITFDNGGPIPTTFVTNSPYCKTGNY